jgi:hypothetical protein
VKFEKEGSFGREDFPNSPEFSSIKKKDDCEGCEQMREKIN